MATNPDIEIRIAAQANQFYNEIAALKKRLASLEAAFGKTSNKINKKFIKSTNQGQTALLDFSRVIQDAPFGIIGVGNNLQQLSGSFGAAAKSSGGFIGAIRSMGAAIGTPAGGLVLAVSLITTGLTLFQQRSQKAKKEAKDLTEEFKKLNDPLETLKESTRLDIKLGELRGESVRKAREELIGQIKEQISLNEAKIDEAKTNLANLEALRLQKTFIGGIYQAIKFQVLQAWRDFKKDVENTVKGFLAASPALRAVAANILLGLRGAKELASDIAELDQPDLTPTEEEKKLRDQINGLLNDQKKRQIEILELQKEINEEVEKTTKSGPPGAQAEAVQPAGLATVGTTLKGIKTLQEGVANFTQTQLAAARALIDVNQQIEQLKLGFFDIATQAPGAIIDDLTSSVATAIVNGENALQAAGNSLLRSFGKFLSAYGRQLVTYGTLELTKSLLQKAASSGNPAVAIPAAAAAIAVGAAATAAGAALTALSQRGTGAGGAGSATGGGSTSVQSPSFAPSEEVVVFQIQGETLVGVLNRTQARLNRTSGGRVV